MKDTSKITGDLADSFHVRSAIPGDGPAIASFNQAMAIESEGRHLDDGVIAAGVEAVFADPQLGRYFVAELNGTMVGQAMITFEWSDWRNGMFWWIQSVYVTLAVRRRGVFAAIYAHIKHAAKDRGNVCGIRLYVESENAPAHATYKHMGMTPTAYQLYEEDWSQTASDA